MTYHHGKTYEALREDQKKYVTHLMWSWGTGFPHMYDWRLLNRAIKKAKQNLP